MTIYKFTRLTLPPTLEKWRDVLDAYRTLVDQDDELIQQRRAEIAAIRREAEDIRRFIDAFRRQAAELDKYGYNPEEPRVPKHQTGGGEWTKNGTQVAASDTDDAAAILRPRGGHHFVPKAIYSKLPLKPATRKVFDDARTGPLSAARHGWSPEHAAYNQAAAEAFKQFLATNGIKPEDMTPEQALQFVFEVIESSDPRIRDLNMGLYRREILHYILHHMLLRDPLEPGGGPLEIEGGSDD